MVDNIKRYAHLDADGLVENVTLWDGDETQWKPPEGYSLIVVPDHVGIGWKLVGEDWVSPNDQ